MNGFVERMVSIVKSALKRVIKRQVLYDEELRTALCGVEEMINRRPLCAVSDSGNIEILTPLHSLSAEAGDRLLDSQNPAEHVRLGTLAKCRHGNKVVEHE